MQELWEPLPKVLRDFGYERSIDNSLIRKVFDEIDVDEIATISTDKGIGVFKVMEADNGGYISLDNVESEIRKELETEKKVDWATSYLSKKISDSEGLSLSDIADSDTLITYKKMPVSDKGKYTVGNVVITEQSSELLGIILENDPGYMTEPINIKGNYIGKDFNDIAIYKLISKNDRDTIITSITEDEYDGKRREIINQKSASIGTNWQQSILENMSEKDIRDEIY